MTKYKKNLLENVDEKYREFQIKLLPGVKGFMGVRMPIVRKIAIEISKEDPIKYLSQKNFDTYEEKMIYGIVTCNLKIPFEQLEKYIWEFLAITDNWGLCDSFCSSLKTTKKHKQEMFEIVKKAATLEGEYYQRFAAVMILIYYFDHEYTEQALNILSAINNQGYYTKMGVAWAISSGYIKQKEKTIEFLKMNKVDEWTKKKAIQKIGESRLVSKQEIKALILEVN